MSAILSLNASPAPPEWATNSLGPGSGLHQLAPYIGKLKPAIARSLLERYTARDELVLDCFAGSGTIPLEAQLLGRRVIAVDRNPYAVVLTRAKLEAPLQITEALARLDSRLRAAKKRPKCRMSLVPGWVKEFFHPSTLDEAIRFADECIEKDDQFLLACLLGVLHHQRPGFLSYPSSHLVPYLRTRKFPREAFPDMYQAREVGPRIRAKVQRALKRPPLLRLDRDAVTISSELSSLRLERTVDAVVTSPPYMNALDYVRDNRLRMWFVDRRTENYSPEPTDRPGDFAALADAFAERALARLRPGGRCVLVVGETVTRKRVTSHPAEQLLSMLLKRNPSLTLEEAIHDEIPDVRRARRVGAATKRELVLVLRLKGRRDGSCAREL